MIGCNRWIYSAIVILGFGGQALASDDSAQAKTETPEEKVIREKTKAFIEAFNRGDAAALAKHYAKDAEVLHLDGKVTKGRDAIQKELEAFLSKNKGAKLELTCEGVRGVAKDVIIERGCATLTIGKNPPLRNRYTAVMVKHDGEYLIESFRETAEGPKRTDAGPLGEMEWLIGEWVEASGEAVIHSIAEWAPAKKFIFRTFTAIQKDRINVHGTEIITWDPATETIRSWVFESDGGFGERTYTKKDDRWIAKCTGTMHDGNKMSSVNIFRLIDANRMAWQSTNRDIGGQLRPNTDEIIVVRKNPKP